MKASQFSDAQKALILKQGADGVPVVEICRRAGISQATYCNWKKKYEGLTPPEMRRLKLLEEQNAKLKKLVADLPKMGTASVRETGLIGFNHRDWYKSSQLKIFAASTTIST